jgi:UPF0755 protein
MKWIGSLFIALVLVVISGGVFFNHVIYRAGPLQENAVVEISRGVSSQKVAEILGKRRVIASPLWFRLLLKYRQADADLKAGEYLFPAHLTMVEVLEKLRRGDVLYHKFTIPEGYTVRQVMTQLMQEEMLEGDITQAPAEGDIFPETYTFQKREQRAAIIEKAVSAMQRKLQEIWEQREEDLPYKNKQEMLVMASIIEKETGVGDERAKVASVFVNRLRKGMPLQTDPTVIYALTSGKEELDRALTYKDLQVDNPYNTYKYVGLPPTPICNPGEEAIYAAAHPAQTDYLYFVANGTGGHNFAKTLKEHNANVAYWKTVR